MREYGAAVAVSARLVNEGWLSFIGRVKMKIGSRRAPVDHHNSYPAYRSWSVAETLPEVIADFKPSTVILQKFGGYVQAAENLERLGVPALIYIRDNLWTPDEAELTVLRRSTLISNSTFTAERTLKEFGLNSAVVPPVVIPDSCLCEHTGKFITMMGIAPEKGIDFALDLAERLPDLPFLVVRSWNFANPSAQSRIAALPNVSYSDPSLDVRDIYRKTRILIVPSTVEEAWGRVVTEAQINGIPVIASDKGGLPESVGSGGVVLPLEAQDEWVRQLRALYGNEDLYRTYSERALMRVREPDVEPESLIGRLLDLCH